MSASSYRYNPKRKDDAELRDRIRRVAEDRRRFGYEQIWLVLRHEDRPINIKKVHRIY